MKLSQEEQGVLEEFIYTDSLKVVIKVLDGLVSEQETAVLKTVLDESANESDLVYKKLRAEGAARLLGHFNRYVNQLRAKGNKTE